MTQIAVPIMQTLLDLGQTIGSTLAGAVHALWMRDELLFFAVVAMLFQASWILRLRLRLRRLQKQLAKPVSASEDRSGSKTRSRQPVYAEIANKMQFLSRRKDKSS